METINYVIGEKLSDSSCSTRKTNIGKKVTRIEIQEILMLPEGSLFRARVEGEEDWCMENRSSIKLISAMMDKHGGIITLYQPQLNLRRV